jgi:hypothetical protein
MSKPVLGILVGAGLGILDGLSAWFSPDARPIFLTIVIGSTIKGIITGALSGLIARWRQSLALGVLAGVGIGFALSSLAAVGHPDHYWEIVLPGMILGVIVGFVTQRYPQGLTNTNPSRSAPPLVLLVLALLLPSAVARTQSSAADDPLAPLAGLIGRWSGTTEGQPGKGTVEREYSRILGSRFIQVRNRSSYPVQDKNPKGEVHEDMGVFSFDKGRKRIVFRQFHIEGFVSHYLADAEQKPGTLVFSTEAIENIPAGWRARETYILSGADQLEEVFELAGPGKDFELYSRNRLTRIN